MQKGLSVSEAFFYDIGTNVVFTQFVLKGFNMKRLSLVFTALIISSTALASSYDPSSELRLIDRGDGQSSWMTRDQTFKIGKAAHNDSRGDFHRCGGYFDLTDAPILLDRMPSGASKWFNIKLADRQLTQGNFLKTALPLIDASHLQQTVQKLSSYANRFYQSQNGVDSAQWIADEFTKMAANRSDIKVELFKHTKWKQPSVIVTVTGKTKPNEIVVLGGHEDSVNQGVFGPSATGAAPGADDNATGVATVMEAFRVLIDTNFSPDRTIKFMTYSGEEEGLLGSQDIANTFKNQKQNVVAVAQFDMTGFPGAGDQIVFMTDFVNPELTQFSQKLVDTYVKIKWSTDKCGYACSDHASWNKAGYSSVMPFEATMDTDNKAIHTPQDKIELLDFNHSLAFAKLAFSFMAELSTGE